MVVLDGYDDLKHPIGGLANFIAGSSYQSHTATAGRRYLPTANESDIATVGIRSHDLISSDAQGIVSTRQRPLGSTTHQRKAMGMRSSRPGCILAALFHVEL